MSFGRTNYRTGGTRGGADQFKWEDVKNDKYRENYLGHSVNAPVGRWQKNKDLTWYAKASTADRAAAAREELALAKQRDEDLMNEAMGLAPKKRSAPTGQLGAAEVKELLRRGQSERDGMMVERVEGLGAAPTEVPGFDMRNKKTLAERYQEEVASGRADDTYQLPGTAAAAGDLRGGGSAAESKEARRLARKAEKAAKKLKKKEKKERKREKKAKRHSGDERDRSRSRSVSRSRSCSSSREQARRSPVRRRRSRSRSRSPLRDDRRAYRREASRSRSRPRSRSRSRSPRDSHRDSDRGDRRDRSRSHTHSDSRDNRRRRRSRSRSYRR